MKKFNQVFAVLTLALILIFATMSSPAQMFTPQVIASSGNFASTGAGSLSQTIGEMAIQTLTTPGNILTQGFQQPFPEVVGITELLNAGLEIHIFPNPASDKITISIRSDKNINFYIRMLDATAREISLDKFVSSSIGINHNMDITSLAAGIYFIQIESTDNYTFRCFLFSKI